MRRITMWAASTVTMLVLLFSYHTSTSAGTTTSAVGSANDGVVAAGGSGTSESSGSSGSSGSTTVTGDVVSTPYGDVQVQITVADGKVNAVDVTQVPWRDHKDQEINSRAVPILNEEAVSAQSADIDMVSGATFTSEGYIQSLQSALDQAGL